MTRNLSNLSKGLRKKARVLLPEHELAILAQLDASGRYKARNKVMFLLSAKAGLRAKEISSLTWFMVRGAAGEIGTEIFLEDSAAKGRNGGRIIPLNTQLKVALEALSAECGEVHTDSTVISSERGGAMSAGAIVDWFGDFYRKLGLMGCSSHSGRRTFITNAGRQISLVGGSIHDVQELAGHRNLATTQGYIDAENEARRKVVNLI